MSKAAAKFAAFGTRLAAKGPDVVKKTITFSRPRLETFWKYAKVELRPPSLSELSQAPKGVQNLIVSASTGKWKTLSVKEAWLNTLVGLEIVFWFYIGECIGKRGIIGYNIPGAVFYEPAI